MNKALDYFLTLRKTLLNVSVNPGILITFIITILVIPVI